MVPPVTSIIHSGEHIMITVFTFAFALMIAALVVRGMVAFSYDDFAPFVMRHVRINTRSISFRRRNGASVRIAFTQTRPYTQRALMKRAMRRFIDNDIDLDPDTRDHITRINAYADGFAAGRYDR